VTANIALTPDYDWFCNQRLQDPYLLSTRCRDSVGGSVTSIRAVMCWRAHFG
jgi:hypothetical protein